MIRIKDIADRAGVSPTTVSNVIHGKEGRVSRATVEKINGILKEMGYVPSMSARMLANNTSGLIGVAIGFQKKGSVFSMEDPFVSAMIGNLEYQIREHEYYMMLVARHDGDDLIQQALGWNFDGLVVMGMAEQEIRALAAKYTKPIVAIDAYIGEIPGVSTISMDDRGGAYDMANYLMEKGHRRFLFLSSSVEGVDYHRWMGVRQAMEEAGIPDAEYRHIKIPWEQEEREALYQKLLPLFREQTALFFASDYFALEACNFLQNEGIRVPEDISIAGFDDVTYATLGRPRLTTVHQMVDEKARRAVDTVVRRIRGEKVEKGSIIPTRIVERESVQGITNLL